MTHKEGIHADIERAALHNAVKYGGKADAKAVLGTILQLHPEKKADLARLREEVEAAVAEVNAWPPEKQEEGLRDLPPIVFEKPKKELDLPDIGGRLVMRFEPSPSGRLHIGHAYALGLAVLLCQKHRGRLIIRVADTNPENIELDAYQKIPEDAQWLAGPLPLEVAVQSDRMALYYAHAEKALEEGFAYVCACDPERFKELLAKKEACPCRGQPPEIHIERWQAMLTYLPQGTAVVRIKTDLRHPNPALRDWPALRVNLEPHPRQGAKYRVWPLMNFAVTIDDHEMGVTHTIRAKEHMDNEKRAKYLYDHFKWTPPRHHYIGRINIVGLEVSKTKTRQKIEAGEYEGWEDIRLPFLKVFARRGIRSEALLRWAADMGLTQTDKTVSADELFKSLYAHNKRLIEGSPRCFIVLNPARLRIRGAPKRSVELDLHPEHHRGGRHLAVHDEFYVSKADLLEFRPGKLYRLMDCLNLHYDKEPSFVDADYATYKAQGDRIVHWLPVSEKLAAVTVRLPDNTLVKGLGEPRLLGLKEGDLVQAERVGFLRLDRIEDALGTRHPATTTLHFWYAHP